MTRHPVGTYGQLFPKQHIPVILLLILQVGKNIRKQTATDREDWITTRLHRRLIHEPSFRDGPLQIDPQTSIVNSDADFEVSTPEGRLDLKVSCGFGYEVYFAIEAKRLRVSLPSKFFFGHSEYVNDGMMRFVTGQYAPFMQAGAMLGYVYDGETENARADIDRQVQKKAKELKLMEPKRLAPSLIFPDQSIDETNHNLEKRFFTIFHLLIDV
ncbi:MAG: hypothetical protein GY864_07905 [Desulfobacterales bacterium]|nr:hypothetical protein [Desulfobacterales bacterium]